jgi:tetratricopeptide (TPR) repeat protein
LNIHNYISRTADNITLFLLSFRGEGKQIAETLIELNEQLAKDPQNYKHYNKRGEYYFSSKEYEKALKDFCRSLDLNPDHAYTHFIIGRTYFEDKKYEEAITSFGKAINSEPNYIDYYFRGRAYFELKKYEEATKDFLKAIESNTEKTDKANEERADAYFFLGRIDLGSANYIQAITNFGKAIELAPKDTDAYSLLGRVYFKVARYEETIDNFEKAINAGCDLNHMDYYFRGCAYFESKKYEKAIKDFKKAIESNAKKSIKSDYERADAYFSLGRIYFIKENYSEAIDRFNQALIYDLKYTDAYFFLGRAYLEAEKYENAIENLEKVTKLDSKYENAYFFLGRVYLEAKKYNNAIENFKKAAEANHPKYEDIYFFLGRVYFESKKYKEAIENFEKAVKYDPNYIDAYSFMGRIYLISNYHQKAIESFTKAISLLETMDNNKILKAKLHFWRGKSYTHIKNTDAIKYAIKDFESAISSNENFADAYGLRGEIYNELNETNHAQSDFKTAIGLFENNGNHYQAEIYKRKKCPNNAIINKNEEWKKRIKELMNCINKKKIPNQLIEEEKKFINFISLTLNNTKDKNYEEFPYFEVLKRWNSYTPIISKSYTSSRGGGYFIKTETNGIIIDPGFNFIENFQVSGHSFSEIDTIFITHDHNDHTADLESILTLLYKYNDKIKGSANDEGSIYYEVMAEIYYSGKEDQDDIHLNNKCIKKKNITQNDIDEEVNYRFLKLPGRKTLTFYMTLSTYKKYVSILDLFAKNDFTVKIIEVNDEFKFDNKHLIIKVIYAEHKTLLSDKYSIGLQITYNKFVLIYTGDTCFSDKIEETYQEIKKNTSGKDIVLLAHIGGFKDYEREYTFYKNHLGRLGIALLVEILQPKICIISEFGEEFKQNRYTLSEIYKNIYKDSLFFPADIGFIINANMEIRAITELIPEIKYAYIKPHEVDVIEENGKQSLYYVKKGIKERVFDVLK